MTVSHMFYNADLWDTGYNYQQYTKDKIEAQKISKDISIPYDTNDQDFKDLLMTIILSTEATFNPKFEDTEVKDFICRREGKRAIDDEEYKRKKEEAVERLSRANDTLDWADRRVNGDASETGLIKFA